MQRKGRLAIHTRDFEHSSGSSCGRLRTQERCRRFAAIKQLHYPVDLQSSMLILGSNARIWNTVDDEISVFCNSVRKTGQRQGSSLPRKHIKQTRCQSEIFAWSSALRPRAGHIHSHAQRSDGVSARLLHVPGPHLKRNPIISRLVDGMDVFKDYRS